jgi:hypothetical protein
VCSTEKCLKLYEYLKTIVIKYRFESEAAERYLGRIILELNENKNYDIDGDIMDLKRHYDCWTVNPYEKISGVYFVKKVQQKNENTVDQ